MQPAVRVVSSLGENTKSPAEPLGAKSNLTLVELLKLFHWPIAKPIATWLFAGIFESVKLYVMCMMPLASGVLFFRAGAKGKSVRLAHC